MLITKGANFTFCLQNQFFHSFSVMDGLPTAGRALRCPPPGIGSRINMAPPALGGQRTARPALHDGRSTKGLSDYSPDQHSSDFIPGIFKSEFYVTQAILADWVSQIYNPEVFLGLDSLCPSGPRKVGRIRKENYLCAT